MVLAIASSLPATMEWTEVDATVLRLALAQAQDLDLLESTASKRGVAGFRERRFARLALVRIIGQLDVPQHARSTVLRAQKAAAARWGSSAET